MSPLVQQRSTTICLPTATFQSCLVESPHDVFTDAKLDALNINYSRICIPECLDPIEKFYRCIFKYQYYTYYFRVKLLRKGICGQESGDYCTVRYNRQYNGNDNDLSQLIRACDITDSGISCNSYYTSYSNCTRYVEMFSSRMGCCTEPYLGSGVRSCSGVSVDEACTGVSSATGLVAPVFLMLFALVGFFF